MTDHQHLRELAEQATPGPWRALICGGNASGPMPEHGRHGDGVIDGKGNAILEDESGQFTDLDAEFIAAANPAVVLDLLDRIATLTAQVSNQAAELEDTRAAYQLTRHQLDAHRAGQGTWVHAELGGDTYVIHEGNTK